MTGVSVSAGRSAPTHERSAFLRSWTVSKAFVAAAWALLYAVPGFYDALRVDAPDVAFGLGGLLLYLAVWTWLYDERRVHADLVGQYGGFALYLLWPLFVPMYSLQTRGVRRTFAALLVFGLLAFSGAVAGTVLGTILRSVNG